MQGADFPLPFEADPRSSFFFHLKEEIQSDELPCLPGRRSYACGEVITADIYGLDGNRCGAEQFYVAASVGSGFAGQVYRARPAGTVVSRRATTPSPWVALKVLRPKARWKEIFRDLLFQLSYQVSFAPRSREAALRSGLIWQEILRLAAEAEFGAACIPQPLGYYWES